jgi:hypothetical protein
MPSLIRNPGVDNGETFNIIYSTVRNSSNTKITLKDTGFKALTADIKYHLTNYDLLFDELAVVSTSQKNI